MESCTITKMSKSWLHLKNVSESYSYFLEFAIAVSEIGRVETLGKE